MSREQLFICAMETREKQLLAQELYKRNGRCDVVRYEDGAIVIDNGDPIDLREEGGECTSTMRVSAALFADSTS